MENRIVFEGLNFHDCKIYGLGFNTEKNQLLIDIDFIEEWTKEEGSNHYIFSLIPSTLVFENVWDLNMDISMNVELIINNIERLNPCIPRNIDFLPKLTKEYDWKIELFQGEINFKSVGLKIYKRDKAINQHTQAMQIENRGGIILKEMGILYCVD